MTSTFRLNDGYYVVITLGLSLCALSEKCFTVNLQNAVHWSVIYKFHLYKRPVDDILTICDENNRFNNILLELHNRNQSITLCLKSELNSRFHTFAVLLKRRPDFFPQSDIKYIILVWNMKYTNFQSWVPLVRKGKLIHCLSFWAR